MAEKEKKPIKFGNLSDWQTDDGLCRDGAPLDLGEGRVLYCRRAGTRNREFLAAVRLVDTDDADAQMNLYATNIVTNWAGMLDADGEPMPFSPEACLVLFESAPEVFDQVVLFSAVRSNFRAKQLGEEREAVKRRSGGNKGRAHTRSN